MLSFERLMRLHHEYRIKPGREEAGIMRFLGVVHRHFPKPTIEYNKIHQAVFEVFQTVGRGERDNGDALISHQLEVAIWVLEFLEIRDADLVVSALHHDSPEDFWHLWTHDRLYELYGIFVSITVFFCTKLPKEDFGGDKEARDEAFHQFLLLGTFFSMILKLLDRIHNLVTLWTTDQEKISPEKRFRKVKETRDFYATELVLELLTIARTYFPEYIELVRQLGEVLEEACEYASAIDSVAP
jgi:(p)ppGpp synthase/HD superfamily hydrolase